MLGRDKGVNRFSANNCICRDDLLRAALVSAWAALAVGTGSGASAQRSVTRRSTSPARLPSASSPRSLTKSWLRLPRSLRGHFRSRLAVDGLEHECEPGPVL
jgi:hypothetical protein